MTNEKSRKFLGNFGDVNWVEHGGLLLFDTGCDIVAYKVDMWPYSENGETLDEMDLYHPDMKWNVTQFSVEKYYLFDDQLVDSAGNVDWVNDEIEGICSCMGMTEEQFIGMATSDEPRERLGAYEAIGSYSGYCELSCGYEDYVTAKELKQVWFSDIMDSTDLDLRYCRKNSE